MKFIKICLNLTNKYNGLCQINQFNTDIDMKSKDLHDKNASIFVFQILFDSNL